MIRRRAYAQITVELPTKRMVTVEALVSVHGGVVKARDVPPRGQASRAAKAFIKIVREENVWPIRRKKR